ncbi:glutamate-5-semialdehyde dehydrogenase [Algihabitans albus]|uniref:glutamate-5-semialdehyde dehydrogenase n=1 Tax=Algihabitans albus TaxID=2164067 RepID=UPI000E5D9CE7|nr:glutamate-5-semialdehyde dehydrogenase [Algihabitans albus]
MNAEAAFKDTLEADMLAIGSAAREAASLLATASAETKQVALRAAAAALREDLSTLLAANRQDMAAARARDLTPALLDRLELTEARVEAMAGGVEAIAAQPDPVGRVLADWERPNGLVIERVAVPLGVVGIVYESRPNVTADAGALCLKAGNAAILRGGSESFHSSGAILAALHRGLAAAGLPEACLQRPPSTDRAAVGHLLRMHDYVDVIVPRGGRGLIERVMREATVPVLAHLDGNCHTYIHAAADPSKARAIAVNAKMRRTGICGATETLLIDREVAERLLPPILEALAERGCELRGDAAVQALDGRVLPAKAADWDTEFLAPILAIKTVEDLEAAIDHVNRHGSHHTDAIVTEDAAVAETFLNRVDSAIVMHNASTQFADGGEFGMGAEIGISTGRLHARGPVGANELTIYKYRLHGQGQIRP